MNCPCSSGQPFDQCCERFISHRESPENALQLMRSRYSAYVVGDASYLLDSWHADFRPANLEFDPRIRWLGLKIISSDEQLNRATVDFEASLLLAGRVESMHESSAFVREQGRWLYTSGEMLAPSFSAWRPGRNEDCPCGSGLKFKRCCAI